jgi:hypothetical protein
MVVQKQRLLPMDIRGEVKVKVKYMNFVLQNEGVALTQMAKVKFGSGEGEGFAISAVFLLHSALQLKPDDVDALCSIFTSI